MQNKRTPVNGLPPETLLHIFNLIDVPTPKKSFPHPLALSHVSALKIGGRFESSFLDESICGTFDAIRVYQASARTQWFPTLISHPPIVSFPPCAHDPSVDGAYFCPHGNCEEYVRLLDISSPHRHRIATLNVWYMRYLGNEDYQSVLKRAFFYDSLPSLERLSWVSRTLDSASRLGVLVMTTPTKIFCDSGNSFWQTHGG
jgi:hypothetical protein